MNTKKSAIDLTEIAIGVMLLGITVGIGAAILIKFRDARLTSTQSLTATNEVKTTVTESGEELTNSWFNSVSAVTNESGTTIPAANYSISTSAFGKGTIASIANGGFNNTNWNVTYSYYNESDPQFAIPNSAAIGLAEYGNWFKIIVIVGIAAVILALIFLAFGSKGVNSGSSGGGVSF